MSMPPPPFSLLTGKLQQLFHLAHKGLGQLSMYSDLPKRQGDWAVNLDANPMPRPATEEELEEDERERRERDEREGKDN